MKINRSQLRKIISNEVQKISESRERRHREQGRRMAQAASTRFTNRSVLEPGVDHRATVSLEDDTEASLRAQASIGRESTPDEDKIIEMMIGDDDPNIFDLIYNDPRLEKQESLKHVRSVVSLLQNHSTSFTPRVQNSCTGVYSGIKYYDGELHPLFKALQHHLHNLNPALF